jgi:hypothetical protein
VKFYQADWICPASGPPIPNGAFSVENGRITGIGFTVIFLISLGSALMVVPLFPASSMHMPIWN